MTYKSISSLPESVRHVLPKHAQEIYFETYNNAWAQYDKPEERLENRSRAETAHRIAWSAVKKRYVKDETTGKWIRKEKTAVR
jgi:cation transport regulator